ncbi:MAG: alternative ribosome rescue aminoacyl-tRNA hydrolase ArfB [Pseudomonadota bacterium]
MIRATSTIAIDEKEIEERFVRSSGPGGQNVNKVATAVQLRFNVRESPSLSEEIRMRLMRIAGKRISDSGILVIEAKRYRTQERNRSDALERFVQLIQRAAEKPRPRRKTRPAQASKEGRLRDKKYRGMLKSARHLDASLHG